jgi:hypothetical protein
MNSKKNIGARVITYNLHKNAELSFGYRQSSRVLSPKFSEKRHNFAGQSKVYCIIHDQASKLATWLRLMLATHVV